MANLSLVNLFPETLTYKAAPHQSLGEEFSLCGNGNMVFHWADFNETCDIVKAALNSSPELQDDFKKRETALNRLSLIPIWIKANRRVHQMTMFELYERHILQHETFNSSSGPMEVSFISSSGPFKEMFISECFNNITYRDFILVYLLKDKLPKRNFRIRLKSKVLMEYGSNFDKVKLIGLDQLTAQGLLLSMDAEVYERDLKNESQMRLLIDTKVLKDCVGLGLSELKEHLAPHTFNLLYSSRKVDAIHFDLKDCSTQVSFDFTKNRKVYMYVPFNVMAKSDPASAKILSSFVDYAKNLVRNYYQDISRNLKSA